MPLFHVLLTGPGHPGLGTPLSGYFARDALVLDQLAMSVPLEQLVVSVGGMEQPELHLNWLDAQGRQWSLRPADAGARATLMAQAPAALQPQLAQWHQRGSNTRRLWTWLYAGLAACVALALLLWWSAPRLAGQVVQRIPISLEEKLGRTALAQLRGEGKLLENGAAQQAVQQIGARLTAGSPYTYRWLVKEDESVNAFAMPGGIVVVHTGLLRQAASATELAGVLAHEVQHVEQRHTLHNLVESLSLSAVLMVTLGDVSGLAAVLARQLGDSYFSRELEEQADRLGFQALVRAKIDPNGMLVFFRKLEARAKAEAGFDIPAWISSHPQTPARSHATEALIAATPCPDCRPVALDWPALQASLGTAPAKRQDRAK